MQRRALSYFAPERNRVLCLLGVMLTSALAGLVTAWPIAILIDSVLVRSPKDDPIHRAVLSLLPSGKLGQIAALAAGVASIRILQELLRMARTLLSVEIGHRSLMRVRCEVFQKLQALHLGYHRAQPAGDALQRLTADAGAFQGLLSTWMAVSVSAASLVFMTVVMLHRNVPLTALALSVAPLLVATNVWFERKLKHRSREAREIDGALTTTIHRALATIGLVQTFCREADEYDRFQTSVHRSAGAWLRLHRDEVRYFLTVGVLLAAAAAAVFGYGAHLVRLSMEDPSAAGAMSAGDLMVFLAYLGMLFEPLSQLTGASATVQSGIASAERVFQILDRDPVLVDAPDARPMPQLPRTLHLEDVSFEYTSNRPVLSGVSVAVEPGELVAFVGPSGAGKSTLLNLLPRLQDPTSGRLRLGDHDLRSLNLKDVRRHVALVLQEAVMLPTTIAENIAYGRPDAGEEEIRAAAELSGAATFIGRLKNGYETRVLDGGQNLSGGQRQRIGLARALLTRAPILVLDEPTSSLDAYSERLVMQTLEALRGKRTIILVTHRLATVTNCDRIFVLDAGRIAEQGSHAELLRRPGAYRDLVSAQGDREPEPPLGAVAHAARVREILPRYEEGRP